MDGEREEDSGVLAAVFSRNGLSGLWWRRLGAASGPQALVAAGGSVA